MKRKCNKNKNMDIHVLKRFKERFKRNYNISNIKDIVEIIQTGNAEPIFQVSRTRKVYSVTYNGQSFGCVYNNERKRLHTVFPIRWINDGTLEQHILFSKEEVI